jgi:hypothetical protein
VRRLWHRIRARGPFGQIARLEARVEELLRLVDAERGAARVEAARLDARLDALMRLIEAERGSPEALRGRREDDVWPLLVALARDDAGHRRRLHRLRARPDYALAYTDPDPLVTVAIATRGDRLDLLMDRALPSALAQTHAPLEVVVVGDAAGEAARAAVEGLRDPRVRFFDLTQRFEHPDARRRWLTAATLPRNEAYHRARGRWIADLDDDDALRPDAVARLLALARARELEVAYGMLAQHHPAEPESRIGTFPPRLAEPSRQVAPYRIWEGRASCGALVHAGLRLFAREHIAAEIGQPGDFYRVERMVLAGVRFGMLDAVVYDYYPSSLWRR